MFKSVLLRGFFGFMTAMIIASGALSAETPATGPAADELSDNAPLITKLKPEKADGRGYRLVYTVDAPLAVTWNFKTDFASQVLLSNQLISSHRLISRDGNEVVTETVYSNKPKRVFRWKTTMFPEQHLLKFVLLNPEACGQKYHYGTIQLQAEGSATRVSQVAYLDFFGVSLWVNYPLSGGMSHFLNDTARWEQQAVLKYRHLNQE